MLHRREIETQIHNSESYSLYNAGFKVFGKNFPIVKTLEIFLQSEMKKTEGSPSFQTDMISLVANFIAYITLKTVTTKISPSELTIRCTTMNGLLGHGHFKTTAYAPYYYSKEIQV